MHTECVKWFLVSFPLDAKDSVVFLRGLINLHNQVLYRDYALIRGRVCEDRLG